MEIRDFILCASVLCLLLALVNGIIVGPIIYCTSGYDYRERIGSHLYNAVEATTFEDMKCEIEIAVEHLHEDGVDDSDYRCLVFRTEHDKMSYWFGQLDGILQRLDEAIVLFSGNNTINTTEEYADVYGFKLENIRTNLIEVTGHIPGEPDLGEQNFKYAWYIENHIVRHIMTWWTWWILLLIGGLLLLICFVISVW